MSRRTTPEFAQAIAALGDVYVNDAFGTCHNDKDASMVAVPAALKAAGKLRAVGLLVAKELEIIDGLMTASAETAGIGDDGRREGVSDKIAFINALLTKVDHLLIGGKMAYTFLKAQGMDIGSDPRRRRGRSTAARAAAAVLSVARSRCRWTSMACECPTT